MQLSVRTVLENQTLINLVTGLLSPNCGNIFFDGINIHQDLYKFRKQIGYVPQDTFLLMTLS